jgi:hypothetical protein
LFESIAWMIGLELATGSLLIVWAVARLRAACRKHEEGDEPSRSREPFRWLRPLARRRPCGENPVLWKELHTARPRGLGVVVGGVIVLGLTALIGYGTYKFARPAFLEWYAGGTVTGPAISDFNEFLRIVTSWVEFFTLLIAAGIAAEGVTAERARETWDGLIATPLDRRAILQAKMIGAAWRVRWGLFLLGVLWSVGLLAGALHPAGFAAALVLLGVATWFMVALGTFMSLFARDTAQASNRTLIPVLLLSGSFLLCYVPTSHATILMGIGSAPFVNWLTLMSYREIGEIVSRQGSFSQMTLATSASPIRVVAACLLGMAAHAAAAAGLSRAALDRFDRGLRARPAPHTLKGPAGRSDLQDIFRHGQDGLRCSSGRIDLPPSYSS